MQTTTIQALTALLDLLPELFRDVVDATAHVGAALGSAREALVGQGGRVLLFQSTLCSAGPGALPNRDPPGGNNKVYGTEKECLLFTPQQSHSKWYTDLARTFAVEQIAVDIFAATRCVLTGYFACVLACQDQTHIYSWTKNMYNVSV